LPKAILLKTPHHGAADAYNFGKKESSYLDICERKNPVCSSVIFAGDRKHPDPRIFKKLREKTKTYCVINGNQSVSRGPDLGIEIEGAKPSGRLEACQGVVSFEVDDDGNATCVGGFSCDECPIHAAL